MKKNVNTLIIFAMIIYINSLNIEAFECPVSDGFFADPEDPAFFYHCINNHSFHFECSGELVFDNELKECMWPTADITRKPSTTTTITSTDTTTSTDTASDTTVTRVRHTDGTETTTAVIMNSSSTIGSTSTTGSTPAIVSTPTTGSTLTTGSTPTIGSTPTTVSTSPTIKDYDYRSLD